MCSVVGCDSWRRHARRFPLPEDPEKRLEWVQFLFEVNGQRLKESSWTDITVCTEHFTPDCFLRETPGTAVQLKSGAVPLVHVHDQEELHIKQEPVESPDEDPAFEPLDICHSPAFFKEETSSVIASPRSSDGSESSKYDYVQMLQKIENLDIIRKKAGLLQVDSRYVVNEKQLFTMFSSKCPLCRSKVKTEKAVQGLLLAVNQQCVQCKYRKEWKNLSSSAVTADEGANPTERSEVTLETDPTDEEKTRVPEIIHCIGEDSDPMEDFSSSQDDVDSGDDWQPEEELLFYHELQEESDEESNYEEDDDGDYDDDDDDLPPKNRELCTDCGRFFDRRQPHTCEHKIKPYSCNICGKRFVNETSITAHSKIHEESYEIPCKYCNAKFKTKVDKITHEQVHVTEEKPYKCPECSEEFATNKERRIHLQEGEWPHSLKCHICGIQFYQSTSIRRHLLVHSGEKPFKCPVCQRGFSQASHLKSHMRLHTGEKPYKCQHCDQSFNHNVSLKSHYQRYHSPNSRHAQKKKMKGKGSNPGNGQDNGSRRVADSGVDNVEQDSLVKVVKMLRTKPKKKVTGRPKGRPKKGQSADPLVQEENMQRTDKRKPQESKDTTSSDEESDELTEDEEFSDSMEEQEKAEKVTSRASKSRGRPKASDLDSDFEPTEIKKKRRNSKNIS
ncbi:zinc finger protein 429-like [Cololabis saira]|uniref:zinc finger protein 429-like n=1 Tax=Cololabis saira TaxID=129043 RepID=UPI002AD29522|nr:zinc finger protein 429-like [Cololabis saira]